LNPTLLSLGPINLEWHGVLAVVGIIVAIWLLAGRYRKHGLAIDNIPGFAIWTVIGGMIGARLFHVIDYWSYYIAHPLQMLSFTQGGLAVYGAVVCGFATALGYLLLTHQPAGKILDLGTPAMMVGLAIGRIGCTINGDAWGAPTGGNWGLVYTNPGARLPAALLGVPTHPFPLYEIAVDLFVAGLFWWLGEEVARLDGRLTLAAMGVYGVGRFGINVVRQEQVVLLGMQQAQVVSVIIVAVAIIGIAALTLFARSKPSMEQAAS
jgi:phosphatidylglycerol---prolipoprotein diacylglyceryl transferase